MKVLAGWAIGGALVMSMILALAACIGHDPDRVACEESGGVYSTYNEQEYTYNGQTYYLHSKERKCERNE